jgi:hypothetical protein
MLASLLSANLLDTCVEVAVDPVSRYLTGSRFSICCLCFGKDLSTSRRHTEAVAVRHGLQIMLERGLQLRSMSMTSRVLRGQFSCCRRGDLHEIFRGTGTHTELLRFVHMASAERLGSLGSTSGRG